MNETTVKAEQVIDALQSGCLCGFLQESSVRLRNGEDAKGIEDLLSAVSELEKLVEYDQNSLQPRIDLQRLLPAVRTLCFYITNNDIAGVADLLEDVLYPMTGECSKGGSGI